jgi:drug/metabolite transporter (DMT)-like permease
MPIPFSPANITPGSTGDEACFFFLAITSNYARQNPAHGEACETKLYAHSEERGNDSLMFSNGRLRWKLALGLLAAIMFDTLLQLTWKTTVLETPAESSPWATLGSVFANPLFLGVITLMTLQFFNWLAVLSQADLSYAKPIAALSYASVPVFSVLVLGETVDSVQIAGLACVIAGVWFISQTKSLTQETRKLP